MANYGSAHYGSDFYGSSEFWGETYILCGLKARIIKPPRSSPPIIDSIVNGLAIYFDYLQQAIQVMGYMNKIEYAQGYDSTRPNDALTLDGVWGELYDCPRFAHESDELYRRRLQTRLKVLTSSGTAENAQKILDHLIGIPGDCTVEPSWPAIANINISSVEGMRRARDRSALLNSVLPDLFAAGISYNLNLPFLDCRLNAAILGDASLNLPLRSAIQVDQELTSGFDTLIAYARELPVELYSAIRTDKSLSTMLKCALRGHRELQCGFTGAIRADCSLSAAMRSAVKGDTGQQTAIYAAMRSSQGVESGINAAIFKHFEIRSTILALCVLGFETTTELHAAVRSSRQITSGIKARIARRSF